MYFFFLLSQIKILRKNLSCKSSSAIQISITFCLVLCDSCCCHFLRSSCIYLTPNLDFLFLSLELPLGVWYSFLIEELQPSKSLWPYKTEMLSFQGMEGLRSRWLPRVRAVNLRCLRKRGECRHMSVDITSGLGVDHGKLLFL